MRSKRKERELYYLEQFIKVSGIHVQEIKPKDPPDFHAVHDDRPIGIEITQVHVPGNGLPLQVQESVEDKVLATARNSYLRTAAPPVELLVRFGSGVRKSSFLRDEAAEKLVACVVANPMQLWERAHFEYEALEGLVPEEIESIRMLGVPEHRFARWCPPRPGFVATLTHSHLKAAIEKKSPKYQSYRKDVEEVWLVMVSDRLYPSQKLDIPSDFDARSIHSPFDRTFFFVYPEGQWVEVGQGQTATVYSSCSISSAF